MLGLDTPNNSDCSFATAPTGVASDHATLVSATKSALRRSTPPRRIVGRVEECAVIREFFRSTIVKAHSGSLYVSGNPGTGKTACILSALHELEESGELSARHVEVVFLNCTAVTRPGQVYAKILAELGCEGCEEGDNVLEEFIDMVTSESEHTAYLVILDEIDSLLSRSQQVLYRLFDLASRKDSRLALVGIANALDLTDRFLPRLQVRGCEPRLLNFRPYQVKDIVLIIKDRLASVRLEASSSSSDSPSSSTQAQATTTGLDIIQPAAIEICARKVAAVSGDLRQALDVCLKAFEAAIALAAKQPGARTLPKVTVAHVVKILSAIYGAPADQKLKSLNFQSQLVLCCFLVVDAERSAQCAFSSASSSPKRIYTSGELFKKYADLSTRASLPPISQSEFMDLLSVLEVNGILSVERSKQATVSSSSSSLAGRSSAKGRTAANGRGMGQVVSLSVQPSEVIKAVKENPVLKPLLIAPLS
ncbi:AAA ATPase [Spiromyces aspiralis]|uniref:AAA ATPase n=1 Tax=Spiromyces aspiralis TaxID=68401 RepID=A0ACC1HWV9_9FUNG|nr:AAA ATPase [Spiromyces aspiralis]